MIADHCYLKAEMNMNKIEEYKKLVDERKACRRCQSLGLTNPAAYKGGCYDSEQIGPWSLWQGNLNAPLMVVGQDWGGTDYFLKNRGCDKSGNSTDLNLIELIEVAGFSIKDVYLSEGQNVLFFTNAILCLKDGNLQAEVQKDWFSNCALFLRKQIEIVNPLSVVGLGEDAYRTVLSCYNLKACAFRAEVEAENGRALPNGIRVFGVYHCGNKSINMNRPMEAQRKDWLRIRRFLEKKATPLRTPEI